MVAARQTVFTYFLQSAGALGLTSAIAPSTFGSVGPTPAGAACGVYAAGGIAPPPAGATIIGLAAGAAATAPPSGAENVAGMAASTLFMSGSGSVFDVWPVCVVERYRIVPSAANRN